MRRRILLQAAKLFDLAVMIASFGLATLLVASRMPAISLAEFLTMRVKVSNYVLFASFIFVWSLIFRGCGLYNSQRLATRSAETGAAVKATSISAFTIFFGAAFFHIGMVTPLFVPFFWAVSTAGIVSSRVVLRAALARIRLRGRNLRHVLVVGTNGRAVRFVKRIESRPELGYRVVGFVDDHWTGMGEWRKNGYPLVSDLAGFPAFLRDHVVDEVVMALPMESGYGQAARIAALCEEQGIIVRLLSNLFNLRLAHSRAEQLEGATMITLYIGTPDGWQYLMKRTLDVALSLSGMLGLAPVFLLAALAVKFTSPGPVFFVQERVGLNKRRFRLIKFRTMVLDAELRLAEVAHLNEASGPVFKIRNDPRLTRVGRFLRKTSIDELPQLFNVLKGDMSLVGPRPLPVRDYQGFEANWQRRRFSVRPGITCLWQVNGRSSIPFEKWMELDMQYVDNWSLGLDLKILAKTVPAVMKGSGAA